MENKTLQDFKDEYAKNLGYDKWEDTYLLHHMDKIAINYASHVAEQACRKQREILINISNLYGHTFKLDHWQELKNLIDEKPQVA